MIAAKLLDLLAAKLFNELFDAVRAQLLGPMQQSAAVILSRIDQLDDKIELQMASPLKAGITFVKLQLWEQALTEFVRAEATDPFSPVAKCWLAALLMKNGHEDQSRLLLRESLELNPFVLDNLHPHLATNAGAGAAKRARWSRALPSPDTIANLPPLTLWKRVTSDEAQRASSAVQRMSTSGPSPIVEWILGGDLGDKPERLVTRFDLMSGQAIWNRQFVLERLQFATPRVVVLLAPGSQYYLLDATSGATIRTTSKNYFEATFHPAVPGGTASAYNSALMEPKAAWHKTTTKVYTGLRGFFMGWSGVAHEATAHDESLTLPVITGAQVMGVFNRWSHAHNFHARGQTSHTTCSLWCQATIACSDVSGADLAA